MTDSRATPNLDDAKYTFNLLKNIILGNANFTLCLVDHCICIHYQHLALLFCINLYVNYSINLEIQKHLQLWKWNVVIGINITNVSNRTIFIPIMIVVNLEIQQHLQEWKWNVVVDDNITNVSNETIFIPIMIVAKIVVFLTLLLTIESKDIYTT